MKALLVTLILLLAATSTYACTAFFTHDEVYGMSKICYYDHLGETVAITIGATDLCPLTTYVNH